MEANLTLRFDCANKAMRDTIAEYLTADGRPIFEEDALPEYREFFTKIEDMEYPDSIQTEGETTVHAYFFLGGDFTDESNDILSALLAVGVEKLVAYLEADEYIEFFFGDDGSLGVYSDWNKKRVDQARGDLEKGFKYLDEISQQI